MILTVQNIVDSVGGSISGDSSLEITDVAEIDKATKGQITFLANSKYEKFLETSQASAIVVPEKTVDSPGKTLIRTSDPYFTFMKIIRLFHPQQLLIAPGIHASAVVHPSAVLRKDVNLGAHVVIGRDVKIGKETTLMPGVVVGDNAVIGDGCVIHAQVSIREGVAIGNRVIIHDGTVIGSDGFGFAPHQGVFHKIPQVGTVVIEDDVEIGANVAIDRAALGETRIKRGTKLDNLIQVAHNCQIGEDTVIAAQAGVSGSTTIGNHVQVGGQVGFAGHLEVGDGVAIGAQSGISKNIPSGQMVFGTPAKPMKEEFKLHALIKRLPDIVQDLKEIKKKLEALEGRNKLND